MHPKEHNIGQNLLSEYAKAMRKQYNLTQIDLLEKSGVSLRFVRELGTRKAITPLK